MKTVMAFGTFDVLHPGHIRYLEKAKSLGDRLVVVIARDDSIRMFKKREPIFDETARLKIVGSLKIVDKAILGNKLRSGSDIYNIFKKCRPDVIALGYDQRADIAEMRRWLEHNRIRARIVRLHTRLNDNLYKSSKLMKKIVLTSKA